MKTGLIVCGALGREVKDIVRQHGWDVIVSGVSPADHLRPHRIAPDVEKRILALRSRCDRLFVVFGDCGSQGMLDKMLSEYGIPRTRGPNCYAMYAGDLYAKLLTEELGTFFLTDFLVRTFRRAVINGLGLDRFPQLKEEFFHNCRRVVYLIQREDPALRREAESIASYIGLPLSTYFTGYGGLERQLDEWMRLETKHATPEKGACKHAIPR